MGTSTSVAVEYILILVLMNNFVALSANTANSDDHMGCIKSEREALLKFKQSLIDHSNRLLSWQGDGCCEWHGVACSNISGHVIKLDLRNPLSMGTNDQHVLGGVLHPSLVNLTHLNYLDLSMNNFTGPQIPSFLGSLQNLEYLNLSSSNFRGKVPQHLGNLSRLRYLDLSANGELDVDDLHFVSTLSSLKLLDLSVVPLVQAKNWLQSINMLASLVELHLGGCFIPHIPLFPKINLTSLAVLDLAGNYFNSTIPHWLFNISHIQVLDLRENSFQGCLPDEMGNLSLVTSVYLSRNKLECKLPETLGNLCQLRELDLSSNAFSGDVSNVFRSLSAGCAKYGLKNLNLGDNSLSGTIPDDLGNLVQLEHLRLDINKIGGLIPVTIGRLLNLRELDLHSNYLNGSIPESIGQLSKLQYLDVASNLLEGIVSEEHFLNLTSLTYLYMIGNSLVFEVGPSWIPPPQLVRIGLTSCKVGPAFPSWLQELRNISILEMSNASISDTIPDWFENISSSILQLDLSHNQIRKSLPKFRESLLPPERVNWRRAIFLDSNMFEGPLTLFPSDVGLLDISNNFLWGNIPPQIGNLMPNLGFLSLSNNHLNGTIPTSLCKMEFLEVLDLSKNQISGRIPQCLKELKTLSAVDMSSNFLSGHIPPLGSLILRSLHLENNSLIGEIPLANWLLLETLDLSQNTLVGEIPSWIGENLQFMGILDLHSNMFYGEIPKQLCQLQLLFILNLANNNLSGAVPSCFINLTAMIGDERSIGNRNTYDSVAWFGFTNSYYRLEEYVDNLLADIRGRELEYTSTLRFLVSIDLSGNDLVGEIPTELTCLSGLRNLDLSGNNLVGHIPLQVGNLSLLESLDLSRNSLSGPIPDSLTDLNYLSYLNLSFNHLSGQIPLGKHLQTLDDSSIYIGNDGLCGPPLHSCEKELPDGGQHVLQGTVEDEADQRQWFYCGLGVGFLTGFVGVCSILYFKDSWRLGLFQLVQKYYDKLLAMVAVKKNQLLSGKSFPVKFRSKTHT
ncbi:hypothetical protein Tsubulata_018793 [Turnera subulata]|uniref:Leucine-rich repeat-containing N-terminal plant-type domain-containing protein n=1 Tax=Turnera subulata TaxID=218843 RepID=A0A9Q0FL55_9ROSI|nr:hypothetical protein Tsubulata_018793 [Turnera subulata]